MQEIVAADLVPSGEAATARPAQAPQAVKSVPVEGAQIGRTVSSSKRSEMTVERHAGEAAPVASPERSAPAPRKQDAVPRIEMPAALEEWRVATRFGGVFFLVNVALALGLYGDFAQPKRRSLDLSLWDFLALVGEKLAGPRLRDDAIWALLAQLASRNEAEEPGASLPPRRRRALRRWLARLLPRLRRRLCRALGRADEPDVAAVLLALPAQVWITPTRVDVSFALAELPVEVRLSGLDRDPGWVPAAGRSVYFHFD
jgi:hypothetical protein